MRTFLLQILPFLTSIFIGIVLFIVEEWYVTHEGISNLILGVASGLLGIPIVFIVYQMANDYSEKKIKKVIAAHLIFEVNYVIIRLLKDLKNILNPDITLTKDSLYSFISENKDLEGKKLHLKEEYGQKFLKYKKQILEIIYSNPKLDDLSDTTLQNVLSVAKELGIIATELEAQNKNRESIIQDSVQALINDIDSWIEFCELEAVISHHSFSLV